MTAKYLTLFVALASGCANVSADRELGTQDSAIVNGRPAKASEQWGTVGMIIGNGQDEWLCTGTLIAPDVIVTAAHCVIDPYTRERAREIVVVAGASDIDDPEDDERYRVERVFPHPQAFEGPKSDDPTGLGSDYDVALLKTEEPITQVSVVPVLPSARAGEALYLGAELTIAGYGRRVVNEVGLSSEDGLHYVGSVHFVRQSEREFLAGSESDADACPGDSGGPVYAELDDEVWLVGATSRGRADFSAVDCGHGGIYTLLSSYDDWIEEHAEDPELDQDAFEPDYLERSDDSDDDDRADEEDSDADESGDDNLRAGERGTCSARPGQEGPVGMACVLLALATHVLRGRSRRRDAQRA